MYIDRNKNPNPKCRCWAHHHNWIQFIITKNILMWQTTKKNMRFKYDSFLTFDNLFDDKWICTMCECVCVSSYYPVCKQNKKKNIFLTRKKERIIIIIIIKMTQYKIKHWQWTMDKNEKWTDKTWTKLNETKLLMIKKKPRGVCVCESEFSIWSESRLSVSGWSNQKKKTGDHTQCSSMAVERKKKLSFFFAPGSP